MSRIVGKTESGKDIRAYDIQESQVRTKGANLNDFQIEMIATTEVIDRDQEVLAIDGWKLGNYKKNPVILLSHNYYQPPIAKGIKVWIEGGKMHIKIEFPEEGLFDLADVIRRLYKADYMRAGSIGFLPIKWEYGDGKNTQYWRKFTEQEMLEFSLVSVPANPEALIEGKSGFKEARKAGVIKEVEFELLRKAVFETVEKELNSGITIFVPKSIEKKDGDPDDPKGQEQDDGHDDDTEHGDPETAGGESPEKQETEDKPQNTEEGDPKKGLTEAQKKYRRELETAIKELLPGLVKTELKALVDAAVNKGYKKEAILHYSQILLGDGTTESKTPEEPDQLTGAIKAGLSEGLGKTKSQGKEENSS